MKILAPVNRADEVELLVKAGAEELYCGVMPQVWKQKYTNMASMNRREWKVSNIESFEEFKRIVQIAHDHQARVCLTLNALYTQNQYPLLLETIELAQQAGIDAFIVADVGLLITLQELNLPIDIHISTGGTTFNNQTANFYQSLGAQRIIVPRHVMIDEALTMAAQNRSMEFELFILNRGCKNIDGFCTFHHGVNEVRLGKIWDYPKQHNWDQKLLNVLRRMPEKVAKPVARSRLFGSVGACFLSYDVTPLLEDTSVSAATLFTVKKNVEDTFNLLTGVDTCGACRMGEMMLGGITSVKIVGRENLTPKKLQDTTFLDKVRTYFTHHDPKLGHRYHEPHIRRLFKEVYGFDCGRRCYYPD